MSHYDDTHTDDEENEKKEDFIITYIMEAVSFKKSVSPNEIAQKIAEDRIKDDDGNGWRKYMLPIKQTAKFLFKNDKIVIHRRGKVVDPHKVKGLIKFSLPENFEAKEEDDAE